VSHTCPTYCHFCPDLDGQVMPSCWGTVGTADPLDISACTCVVSMECEKEGARRLAQGTHVPRALKEALAAWASSPTPGRCYHPREKP